MEYKEEHSWVPADGMDLETAALETVKSKENLLVVAGPGAGKTELLAQRACYLLETNECKWPKRILAISFKRDAAFNIKERVKKRCGDMLAERFDSFTFDAFAGFILNHFHHCLPNAYKIKVPYEISYESDIYKMYEQNFPKKMAKVQEKDTLDQHHRELPLNTDGMSFLIWKQLLEASPTHLSYRMIMRLAQLVIKENKEIQGFLRDTYAYIFLDEFQDTTFLQYDFLRTCFGKKTSIFTAVGDDKQKIMEWAGANPHIFDDYTRDFDAQTKYLIRNFRSAPKLVDLQNILAKELLKVNVQMAANPNNTEDGSAYLYEFDSPDKECAEIIALINRRMNEKSLGPRDFCILVKQQVGLYPKKFYEEKTLNYCFRNEDEYTQLLSDEVFSFLLNSLLLTTGKTDTDVWDSVREFLFSLSYSVDEDKNARYLRSFEQIIQKRMKISNVDDFFVEILKFANEKKIGSVYSDYRNQKNFVETRKKLNELINKRFSQGMSLQNALYDIKGECSIPVMTIHKSKGLEYDTVIFLGLEDNPFRNIGSPNSEDENAFFVALSRAKNQVVFTFCGERPDRNGYVRKQSRDNIGKLYDILINSGIVELKQS